jgi:hypothetical protein
MSLSFLHCDQCFHGTTSLEQFMCNNADTAIVACTATTGGGVCCLLLAVGFVVVVVVVVSFSFLSKTTHDF